MTFAVQEWGTDMGTLVLKQFASIGAMEDYADRKCNLKSNKEMHNDNDADKRGMDWFGYADRDLAVAALTGGDLERAETIQRFAESLAVKLPRAQNHKRVRIRSDQGGELDIHAVYRGDLARAWTKTTREVRRGTGIVRLVVDICANCQCYHDSLKWRGIAGLALCEIIGTAGYSIELVAAFGVNDMAPNTDMCVSVAIKPRNVMLNLPRLAAAIGTPALFRTLGFQAIVQAADEVGQRVNGGLGHYRDVSEVLPVPQTVTQIMVPGNVVDEDSAINWVKQALTLLQGA